VTFLRARPSDWSRPALIAPIRLSAPTAPWARAPCTTPRADAAEAGGVPVWGLSGSSPMPTAEPHWRASHLSVLARIHADYASRMVLAGARMGRRICSPDAPALLAMREASDPPGPGRTAVRVESVRRVLAETPDVPSLTTTARRRPCSASSMPYFADGRASIAAVTHIQARAGRQLPERARRRVRRPKRWFPRARADSFRPTAILGGATASTSKCLQPAGTNLWWNPGRLSRRARG